jgi:hypothetical protein
MPPARPLRTRPPAARLRRWHLWSGIAGGVWLLWLIGTGVALAHAAALGLDRRYVQSAWLLRAYGLPDPAPLQRFALGTRVLDQAGERLYVDGAALPGEYPRLVGVAAAGALRAAVGEDAALLFTDAGALIERVALPAELVPVRRAGAHEQGIVLDTARGDVRTDADFAAFAPLPDPGAVRWADGAALPEADRKRLVAAYHTRSISHARLLADLHSGRLFGPAGPWVVDGLALLLAVQVLTGFVLALPRQRATSGAAPRGRRPPGI